MSTPEEKLEHIREQVTAKVYWGTGEEEVLQWLAEKHAIDGDDAGQLVTQAQAERKNVIKSRAMPRVVVSGLLFIGLITYFAIQVAGGSITMDWQVAFVCVIGLWCLLVFSRSLWQLVTGEKSGPVE